MNLNQIFAKQAATALENGGINPHNQLHALQGCNVVEQALMGPAPVDYNPDKIVYKLTFDLPDTGLFGDNVVSMDDYQQDKDNPPPMDTEDILVDKPWPWQYPTRSCRSVIGNQPYDRYLLRTNFLQLGEVRAHRSVLDKSKYVGMTQEERMERHTGGG
jgi:hypothetical protein